MVTTFQRPTLLPHTVESVLKQDYPSLEVIISDDASQDDTPGVAAALVAADARVRYNRNGNNQGEVMNVNHAVGNLAQGKYFAIMQDDAQYIDPHFIRLAVEAMEQNTEATFVFGCLDGAKMAGNLVISGKDFWLAGGLKCHWLACLFRRVPAIQIGLMEPAGVFHGDTLFLLKMALMGCVVSFDRYVVRTGYAAKSNYADRYKDIRNRYVRGGEHIRRAAAFAVRRKIADSVEADFWRASYLRFRISEIVHEFCLLQSQEQAQKNFLTLYSATQECGEEQLLTETLLLGIRGYHNQLKKKGSMPPN